MMMKTITMANPTDIEGVEEYRELFWIPSLNEHRELVVWRGAGGSYAYDYASGDRYGTGFVSGQAAYEAGVAVVREMHTDATEAQ